MSFQLEAVGGDLDTVARRPQRPRHHFAADRVVVGDDEWSRRGIDMPGGLCGAHPGAHNRRVEVRAGVTNQFHVGALRGPASRSSGSPAKASQASVTAITRAPSGIASPPIPSGWPPPPNRSCAAGPWAPSPAEREPRGPARRRSRNANVPQEVLGCERAAAVLSASGSASLPRPCTRAARSTCRRARAGNPISPARWRPGAPSCHLLHMRQKRWPRLVQLHQNRVEHFG